jgi:hypothetical protein
VTEENDDICRVTPLGTLRYAIEYYAAASVVVGEFGDCVPGRFLIGHAIELALKAFLLQQGTTESFIRRELGHDLMACLASAEATELRKYMSLTEENRALLQLFNSLYSYKRLEYIETGSIIVVPLAPLRLVARRILLADVAVIPTAQGLLRSESGRALALE